MRSSEPPGIASRSEFYRCQVAIAAWPFSWLYPRLLMPKLPLVFTFYIAAPIEKVWHGFVSKDDNQKIFMGADFEVDLKPGGAMTWSGPGKDGKPVRYVTGEVIRAEPPRLLEYRFGMGDGPVMSRVKVELSPETEAVKVVVTNS